MVSFIFNNLGHSESLFNEPTDEAEIYETIITLIVKYSLTDNDLNRTKKFLFEILPTVKDWVQIEGTDQEIMDTIIEKAQKMKFNDIDLTNLNNDYQLTEALPLMVRAYFRSSQSSLMHKLLYLIMLLTIDDEDLVFSYMLLMDAIVYGESSEYIQNLIYEIDEDHLDIIFLSMKTMFLPTDLVHGLNVSINGKYQISI